IAVVVVEESHRAERVAEEEHEVSLRRTTLACVREEFPQRLARRRIQIAAFFLDEDFGLLRPLDNLPPQVVLPRIEPFELAMLARLKRRAEDAGTAFEINLQGDVHPPEIGRLANRLDLLFGGGVRGARLPFV